MLIPKPDRESQWSRSSAHIASVASRRSSSDINRRIAGSIKDRDAKYNLCSLCVMFLDKR
jgi:hypothetical protein